MLSDQIEGLTADIKRDLSTSAGAQTAGNGVMMNEHTINTGQIGRYILVATVPARTLDTT